MLEAEGKGLTTGVPSPNPEPQQKASIMPRIDLRLAGNPCYEAIVRRMGFPQPGS